MYNFGHKSSYGSARFGSSSGRGPRGNHRQRSRQFRNPQPVTEKVRSNPVLFAEFHVQLAKQLHIKPKDLCELLGKDADKESMFKNHLASASKKFNNDVALNAYLISMWVNLQPRAPKKEDIVRVFSTVKNVQSVVSYFCERSIDTLDITWTKCRERPRLQITKTGKLIAFCDKHGLKKFCYYKEFPKESLTVVAAYCEPSPKRRRTDSDVIFIDSSDEEENSTSEADSSQDNSTDPDEAEYSDESDCELYYNVEYRVLKHCTSKVVTEFSKGPKNLADSLFEKGLISREIWEKTNELNETNSTKGRRLNHEVLKKLKNFPRRYAPLMLILKEDHTLYRDLIKELEVTYSEFSRSVSETDKENSFCILDED